MLDQRLLADDDAGRVDAAVAGDPLYRHGDLDQLADLGLRFDQLLEFGRFFLRLRERHARKVRDRPADAVRFLGAVAHHAAAVLDGGSGAERSEGDDLGDVFGAEPFRDVLDQFVPTGILEVHVDVGHRHPLRIEESFECETVFDRIDVGDADQVGDEGPGRRTAHPEVDVVLAGVFGKFPYQQEVGFEARPFDHSELVLESLLGLRVDFGQTLAQVLGR
ncbi:MAG: hypothetical protein SNJ76_07650 [Fimbriimonadaceae bacterium]